MDVIQATNNRHNEDTNLEPQSPHFGSRSRALPGFPFQYAVLGFSSTKDDSSETPPASKSEPHSGQPSPGNFFSHPLGFPRQFRGVIGHDSQCTLPWYSFFLRRDSPSKDWDLRRQRGEEVRCPHPTKAMLVTEKCCPSHARHSRHKNSTVSLGHARFHYKNAP